MSMCQKESMILHILMMLTVVLRPFMLKDDCNILMEQQLLSMLEVGIVLQIFLGQLDNNKLYKLSSQNFCRVQIFAMFQPSSISIANIQLWSKPI